MAVARTRRTLGYPYEYFSDWVEKKVLKKNFSEIDTREDFIKSMEKIREYCNGNDAGKNIYRSYFETSPTTEITTSNITIRTGTKAQKAWDNLIDKEKGNVFKRGVQEIGDLEDKDVWLNKYNEIIATNKYGVTNKKQLIKFMEEQPVANQVSDFKKGELKKQFIRTSFMDAQTGEGRFENYKKIENKDKVNRLLKNLKEDDAYKNLSRLDKERLNLGLGEKAVWYKNIKEKTAGMSGVLRLCKSCLLLLFFLEIVVFCQSTCHLLLFCLR